MVIKGTLKVSCNNLIYFNEKDKIVYKVFNNPEGLEREVLCYKGFKEKLNLPPVVQIDERTIAYPFIAGSTMSNLQTIQLYFPKLKEILQKISNNYPHKKVVKRNLKTISQYYKNKYYNKYQKIESELKNLKLEYIIKAFHPFKNAFCHGDFRTYNLILKDEKIYVIDWEYSGIADINLDLAYLYMTLREHDRESFREFFKKEINKDNFLYFITYYSLAAYFNPKNKKNFKEYIKKIDKFLDSN